MLRDGLPATPARSGIEGHGATEGDRGRAPRLPRQRERGGLVGVLVRDVSVTERDEGAALAGSVELREVTARPVVIAGLEVGDEFGREEDFVQAGTTPKLHLW